MGFGQYGRGTFGRDLVKSRSALERAAPKKQRRYTFGAHSNTCHVWAQQNEETYSGQSSDGRISFNGPTIFSYGSHFPIARFVGEYNGERVVLFNAASYSVSTSSHKSYVRSALKKSDIVIEVPDLRDFDGKADLRRVHESILESIAWDTKAAAKEAEDNKRDESYFHSDYAHKELARSRLALEAFRKLFKVRLSVPANPVAWSHARKAAEAKKELEAKVKEARRVATVAREYTPLACPAENESSLRIETQLRQFKTDASKLYSARQTLAKVKASRKHVLACSAAIKKIKSATPAWESALTEARAKETREYNLRNLERLRVWSANPERSDRDCPISLWNAREIGEYWSAAIRYGYQDVAEVLARESHIGQWKREVPETWSFSYAPEAVTVEEWQNGKGKSYRKGFETTQVRRKGDKLETSHGAECPFSHAVTAFKAAQICRAKGKTWESNGHKIKVGHFGVDRIEADGTLHAGCHVIPFQNMLSLAVREIPAEVRPSYPVPAVINAGESK